MQNSPIDLPPSGGQGPSSLAPPNVGVLVTMNPSGGPDDLPPPLERPSALLVVAHYFQAEENSKYGSASADQQANRRGALERALLGWRENFGPCRELDWRRGVFDVHAGQLVNLDIVILVHGDRHLLDEALLARCGAASVSIEVDNPRMLPFGAHQVIRRRLDDYDWFIYSEDDLLPHDASLFRKQALFQKHFGPHRVLQPNRFETSPRYRAQKTYIDGDLPVEMVDRLWQYVSEPSPVIALPTDLGPMTFERARNPHSGFFMLTREQAAHWVSQPHFLDLDCSFETPLESAGSLSLLKTYSLYKPSGDTRWFLEIEHLDKKYSSFDWPENFVGF